MNKFIRIAGLITSVILTAVLTWLIAFNVTIDNVLATIGGLALIAAALIIPALIILIIFWPKKWQKVEKLRWVIVVMLIVLGLFFGGDGLREFVVDVFISVPWLYLLVLIPMIIIGWLLYGFTINGRPWLPKKVRSWWSRRNTNSTATTTTLNTSTAGTARL